MQKKNRTTYGLSDRYIGKLQKDIILNILIVLVFYGVFNVMFMQNEGYETTIRYVLIVIFLVVGVAVIYSDVIRMRNNMAIHYELTEEALEYYTAKQKIRYPWKDFHAVVVNKNKIGLIYPYEFQTAQGNFTLHKRVADPEELIPAILKRVRPYAQIDPEIPDCFQAREETWLKNAGRRI
ncbi:MAG: hypothetical protein LUC27_02410 [Lachnospiraceae bacterium]|nr:hypothetical protein [Lachnospiraceae bacterium]